MRKSKPENPEKTKSISSDRVGKGGTAYFIASDARAQFRGWYAPEDRFRFFGFRLARTKK